MENINTAVGRLRYGVPGLLKFMFNTGGHGITYLADGHTHGKALDDENLRSLIKKVGKQLTCCCRELHA